MPGYAYVWEFEVAASRQEEFERRYGPEGPWMELFSLDPGYIGSSLLQDRANPLRYVTIDRWASEESFHAFRARYAARYEALDKSCEELTTSERSLGALRSG